MDARTTFGWLHSSGNGPSVLLRRLGVLAFATGLLLALATSGGILGERLSEGSVQVGLLVDVAVTAMSILALVVTVQPIALTLGLRSQSPGQRRMFASAVAILQVLGAALGIAIVHAAVRGGWVGTLPWLSERPGQIVNDSVAVFAILAVVWAGARNLDARPLVLALVVVSLYLATSGRWHLDRPPHGFAATVQQLVVAQFIAVAFAMAVFRVTAQHEQP